MRTAAADRASELAVTERGLQAASIPRRHVRRSSCRPTPHPVPLKRPKGRGPTRRYRACQGFRGLADGRLSQDLYEIWRLRRNHAVGSVVLAGSFRARASSFARYVSPFRYAPRSLLVLTGNLRRNHFPPNCMLTAKTPHRQGFSPRDCPRPSGGRPRANASRAPGRRRNPPPGRCRPRSIRGHGGWFAGCDGSSRRA